MKHSVFVTEYLVCNPHSLWIIVSCSGSFLGIFSAPTTNDNCYISILNLLYMQLSNIQKIEISPEWHEESFCRYTNIKNIGKTTFIKNCDIRELSLTLVKSSLYTSQYCNHYNTLISHSLFSRDWTFPHKMLISSDVPFIFQEVNVLHSNDFSNHVIPS